MLHITVNILTLSFMTNITYTCRLERPWCLVAALFHSPGGDISDLAIYLHYEDRLLTPPLRIYLFFCDILLSLFDAFNAL